MKIYQSIYPPPQLPTNLSLSQFVCKYNPDAVAGERVILEDDWTGKSVTYQGLRDKAAEHAWSLRAKYRLRQDDVIAISGPNSVDHVQLIHAALWTGATAAFISALSTTDDFIHCFSICRPRVVFVDHQLRERANSALMKISGLENSEIIILGHSELRGISSYPKDFSSDNKLPVFNLTQDDNRKHTAVVCFSSGTSSKPKGVELSHFNLIASLVGIRASDPVFYNSGNRGVFFSPLCHIYGLNSIALMSAWLGAYVMLMKQYSLNEFLRLSSVRIMRSQRSYVGV